MAASYGVIGGILVFGSAGYLIDKWLGTAPWAFMLSTLGGVSVAFAGLGRLGSDKSGTR